MIGDVELYVDCYSGSSLSKSEYTVINVGGPDGPPRLVCHRDTDACLLGYRFLILFTRSLVSSRLKDLTGTKVRSLYLP